MGHYLSGCTYVTCQLKLEGSIAVQIIIKFRVPTINRTTATYNKLTLLVLGVDSFE